MNAPWMVVARREYLCRVRSASFRVGTVAGPLLLLALTGLPSLLTRHAPNPFYTIAVVDSAGDLESLLEAEVTAVGMKPARLRHAPQDLPRSILVSLIRDRALDGAVVMAHNGGEVELMTGVSMDPSDGVRLHAALQERLLETLVRRRGEELGFDSALLRSLSAPLTWKTTVISTADPSTALGLALFMAMLLYVTLLTYGLATMRAVVEEKSGRIVELMLSSARPVELLAGKICGLAAVGVTQYLIWLLMAALVASLLPLETLSPYPLPSLSLGVAAACVVYFLLGYALFAALYAMVAGMVNSTADAQQLHLPVTALVVAPIVMVWLIVASPTSAAARALSLIPVFAPVLMVARIALGAAEWSEIVLSITALLVFIVVALWVAARIYRAGILARGAPPTPREVVRWIRYS